MSSMTSKNNIDFFNLSDHAVLKISGAGAFKLLQGQLTCDVNKVPSFSAQCDPKGQMLSLFYITKDADDYLLVLPRTMLDLSKKALLKYAPLFKVTVEVAPLFCIGIMGEHSTGIPIPDKNNRTILITKEKPPTTFTAEEWHALDMEAGIPRLYPETYQQFTPHQFNLDELGALCFDKGCYTGQEVIARIHYRGNHQQHLYRGEVHCLVNPGDPVFNEDQVIGFIVDSQKILLGDPAGDVIEPSRGCFSRERRPVPNKSSLIVLLRFAILARLQAAIDSISMAFVGAKHVSPISDSPSLAKHTRSWPAHLSAGMTQILFTTKKTYAEHGTLYADANKTIRITLK